MEAYILTLEERLEQLEQSLHEALWAEEHYIKEINELKDSQEQK